MVGRIGLRSPIGAAAVQQAIGFPVIAANAGEVIFQAGDGFTERELAARVIAALGPYLKSFEAIPERPLAGLSGGCNCMGRRP